MEMFGNIRCVTFVELVTQGGILSKPNYKKKVREGKIRVLRPESEKVLALLLTTFPFIVPSRRLTTPSIRMQNKS